MIEIWQFVLSAIISYAGIALGIGLIRIAPEEHRPLLSLLASRYWNFFFGNISALCFYLLMGSLIGFFTFLPPLFFTLCAFIVMYGMLFGLIRAKKKTLVFDAYALLFRNLWFFAAAFGSYALAFLL